MGLTEGFEVGAAEGIAGDGCVEGGFQLAAGFVVPAGVDGQGRGGMGGGAAQGCGGLRWVMGSDGPVGALEELGGLDLVVGDGSHVRRRLLDVRGRFTGMNRIWGIYRILLDGG